MEISGGGGVGWRVVMVGVITSDLPKPKLEGLDVGCQMSRPDEQIVPGVIWRDNKYGFFYEELFLATM